MGLLSERLVYRDLQGKNDGAFIPQDMQTLSLAEMIELLLLEMLMLLLVEMMEPLYCWKC